MPKFEVDMRFAVGDRETVARFTLPAVEGESHAEVMTKVDDLFNRPDQGFTRDDLIQVVITRLDHGVAPNLIVNPHA